MTSSALLRRFLPLLLAFILGAAIALPLARWSRGEQLALQPSEELLIECSANMRVEVEQQRARVRCAAPGELSTQAATAIPGAAAPTAAATPVAAPATADITQMIFTDSLAEGWDNWSWGSTIDFANAGGRSGSAVGVTHTDAWSALYLHANAPLPTSGFDTLRFWASGGEAGGQQIRVCGANNCAKASETLTLVAGTWQAFDVPLQALGATSNLNDLLWQDVSGGTQPAYLIDDIALVKLNASAAAPAAARAAPKPGPALAIDATAARRPISPLIYGINFPDEALARELQLPVQRYGGNATTRYNWQNDTSNRASDWFFENIPNENAAPDALPRGSSSDAFVAQAQRTGTQSIMTIPMIGWTPKSREITCAFPTETFANQQQVDPYRPCGNGLTADGKVITGNDPAETSEKIGPAFVKDWIAHLNSEFGSANDGGVAFYNLDNEPFLWHKTHRDVRPDPVSYDELRDLTYAYAAAVKAADPAAQTLGPAEWGWTGYFYSAKDAEGGDGWWNRAPDRAAHNGTPFAAWYLQQMRAYEQQNGVRILDYFDLHYYPQSQGVALKDAGDTATQELRLRSTRALWDTSYKDESWIDEPVYLLPRMREWVDEHYPGTRLALTEYNWGALDDINGALAQADVLGIFGREGLDLATLWAGLANDDPWAYAFRIYRNYDGKGAKFGETSVEATSADQEKLAVYAAERADGALTIVVVNKTDGDLTSSLALTNTANATVARVFRYSPSDLKAIVQGDDLALANNALSTTFPANSITLLELK